MKSTILFALGALAGALLLRLTMAQESQTRTLNHVGIVVEDYEQAMEFYTGALGFREAYTIRRPDGSVQLTYLQLSRNTFVELIPAGPGAQTGITHFGIEVGDIEAAVVQLREQGVEVADPGLTPANAVFVRLRDRDNVDIEVMEFGPEALQRKAMEAWQ